MKSRFTVGQEAIALSGPYKIYPKGRLVTIQSITTGPDGKLWIKAWWPGVDSEEEIKNNWKLEENGLKVDPDDHYVEGPEDKFL